MDTELRKIRNTLMVTGLGVMAFGLWSAVKTLMYFTLTQEFAELAHQELANFELSVEAMLVLFYVLLAIAQMIDLGLRFYIGLSARAEGMGRKKRSVYLVITALFIIDSIVLFAGHAVSFYSSSNSWSDTIISLIIEITSIYTLCELMYAGVKLRIIRKRMAITA